MAHSYTPGLKVLKKTVFKKERILPLKGDVLVKAGDSLNPDTIVASTNLPGNVQMLKVSNILNIDPKDVVEALKVKEGQSIKKGELIEELVIFEKEPENYDITQRRKTLWFYMDEINNDSFLSKFLILE